MASTILIKRSSTASAVPTTGQLAQGELAVNTADKKLYTNNGGAIIEIGTTPSAVDVSGDADVGGALDVTGATTLSTGATTGNFSVAGQMTVSTEGTLSTHVVTKGYIDSAISDLGTAATKDVRTSSTDTTTGRVLTQGNIGFEYQRHIKAAKQFTTGGLGVDEVFYLGTIKAGKHNIRFSTRGNFGFNNYEINLALSFDAAGTDGVSPHNGARIDSKIEGKGATEFLGFSTIKVDSQEAAVYLLYRDPSAVQSIYVGYDSFTADTIGVLPNKTETWTPISVATASSGTHEIPTLLEIDGNTAYFKGFQMYHSGNTNFNVFAIGSGVVLSNNGVGTSTTLVDTDIPLNSYSNPVSITNVGTGYNIQDVATGTLVASSVLPSLAPPSHAKNAIFRFAVSGATSGKRYRIIAAGATTSTVNF